MKITAFSKDILRTISKESKRFFAMIIITILGVTMFSGLIAACTDLRRSADIFFDKQGLHDFYIASTLGLTDDDVKALLDVDGIEKAEGIYTETVLALLDDQSISISMQTLSENGIDEPYLVSGHLPETADEIAVTQEFLNAGGLSVGDTFTIEESLETDEESGETEDPTFANTEYTISGVVIDPTSVNNPDGNTSFRSNDTSDMTVFILPEAVDSDIYTAVLLTLDGTSEMFCYNDEYENRISDFKTLLEDEIKDQREEARYNDLVNEAESELADAEAEVNDELGDAYQELIDGEKELNDELGDAYQELIDGEKELNDSLAEAKAELEKGEAELANELANAKAELDSAAAQLNDAQKQIDDGWAQIAAGEAELARQEQAANEQFAAAWAEIEANKQKLDDGLAQYEAGLAELNYDENYAQLLAAKETLAQAETDAYAQLDYDNNMAVLNEQLAAANSGISTISSQKEAVSALLGEYWPAAEWDALVSAAQAGSYDAEAAALNAALEALPEEIKAAAGDKLSLLPQLAISLGTAHAGKAQIEAGIAQLEASKAAIEQQFVAAWDELDSNAVALQEAKTLLDASYNKLQNRYKQLEDGAAELQANEESARAQIADRRTAIEEKKQSLIAAEAEVESGWAEYYDGLEQYEQGKAEGEQQIADGWAEYEKAKAEAEAELADGWAEYEEGKAEGEAELADGWAEYEDGKAEAEAELADARAQIEDIDMATWYIQDRSSLSSYNNISSDASSIETLGTVFPIIFFTVAILISLTTITRMVDEDRSFIGTYMALGFTTGETKKKYLYYSLTAGIIGSVIGTLCAFFALPAILFSIFSTMYLLPGYIFTFVPVFGILGPAIFIVGLLLVTEYAAGRKMRHKPATLMRPKAPKAGTRIFLERLGPIWSKMNFLGKVTARNIFRYKKRLLMTVLGIAGCTALLLLGFSVKDSVSDLMPGQYERVFSYDILAAATADDNDALLSYIEDDENVEEYINAEITSANLSFNGGESTSVTLMVVPDDSDFDSYIHLYDLDGNALALDNDCIYATRNASTVLDFEDGDTVSLQLPSLEQSDFPVTAIIENYLGNYVYMTQSTFEKYFEEYEPNGVIINLSDKCTDQKAYAEELKSRDGVLSCTSTQELTEDFSGAFELINMVVYVVIIMSAALAFVVLFTLQTTNISEREREIATIKVLGFYNPEVHSYINRETYILTAIGIIIGMPLGYAFAQTLSLLLKLPSIYLPSSLHPVSYVYAALLGIAFAVIVNLITNRSLDRLDPAVALKSVE
ncbi:MAG TPA: FtsX-like permease family protein [Candidatus Alectryocaccobium stercorigallinarum]|nr:FtsX-like permease family protein [Candidatus Alectryocaccobium stercorigallinarum]